MVKLLTVDQVQSMLSNNIKVITSIQSVTRLFKISIDDKNLIEKTIGCECSNIIVIKTIINDNKWNYNPNWYDREKNALMKLQGEKHFPTLLAFNDKSTSLCMTYCGENINLKNMPTNWDEQMMNIIKILQKHRIYNNDMHACNILVKNHIIHLIDFSWASFNKEEYPFVNIKIEDLNKIIRKFNDYGFTTAKDFFNHFINKMMLTSTRRYHYEQKHMKETKTKMGMFMI